VADTAVTGGASGLPALTDNGVPFAFIDTGVINGFRYFYSVTAFDINSVKSGPSSLESPLVTKQVTPRAGAPNEVGAQLTFGIVGDGDSAMVPDSPFSIDPATGEFSGTPPATAATQVQAAFAPLVPQLLPGLSLEFRIDSMKIKHNVYGGCQAANANLQGNCFTMFATFTQGTSVTHVAAELHEPIWTGFSEPSSATNSLGQAAVSADTVASARFGIPAGFAQFNASVLGTFHELIRASQMENQLGRREGGATATSGANAVLNVQPGGSRWFDGANEALAHPTIGIRVGHVAGVDSIVYFGSHIDIDPATAGVQRPAGANIDGTALSTAQQCAPYALAGLGRQADIELTWGAAGAIASVRDKTHHVAVPFQTTPGASWGFFRDNNANGKIDWRDMDQVEGVNQSNIGLTFCAPSNPTTGLLFNSAAVAPTSNAYTGTAQTSATFATTGSGFGLYINGQYFIFELTGGALPAAGTKWTLRTYQGRVTASNPASATPSNYAYTAQPANPAIPGLRVVYSVPARTDVRALTKADLDMIHTVPDPYYVTNSLEITANTKVLRFVNLPPQAVVRIYSASGILVNIISHNNAGLGSEEVWNLRNRNNQFVASGVYFYHVETADGQSKVGRFTVVNYAQ